MKKAKRLQKVNHLLLPFQGLLSPVQLLHPALVLATFLLNLLLLRSCPPQLCCLASSLQSVTVLSEPTVLDGGEGSVDLFDISSYDNLAVLYQT